MKPGTASLLIVAMVLPSASDAGVLFSDSFDRSDNVGTPGQLDASGDGMGGSLGLFAAHGSDTYLEGETSPSIYSNHFSKGTNGLAGAALNHDFQAGDLLTVTEGPYAGTLHMRVSMDMRPVQSGTGDAYDRFVGFGIGYSQASAGDLPDIEGNPGRGLRPGHDFGGVQNVTGAPGGLFFSYEPLVDAGNKTERYLTVYEDNTATRLLHSGAAGNITVDFYFDAVGAGAGVAYVVRDAGVPFYAGSYTLVNSQNYVAFGGRASDDFGAQMDNLEISTFASGMSYGGILFYDRFDRPDNVGTPGQLDASGGGMGGLLGLFAAQGSNTYLEGETSPSIYSNRFSKGTSGPASAALNHDFQAGDLLTVTEGPYAGKLHLRVSMDALPLVSGTGDGYDRFLGFGIGYSQASAGDLPDINAHPGRGLRPGHDDAGNQNVTGAPGGLFFSYEPLLDGGNKTERYFTVYENNTATRLPHSGAAGQIAVDFYFDAVGAGAGVDYVIHDAGVPFHTNHYTLVNNQNYVAFGGRASDDYGSQLDDLEISTFASGTPVIRTLDAGPARLEIETVAGGYGVSIHPLGGPAGYRQSRALAVEVVKNGGSATWVTAPYTGVTDLGGGVFRCAGSLTSTDGSIFSFEDTYQVHDGSGAFQVDRSVRVDAKGSTDNAFSTRLAYQRAISGAMTDYDFFMPAVWYRDNADVGNNAFANTLTDDFYWVREDRLPLPLFMLREKDAGLTFSVIHRDPDGSTFAGDDFLPRKVDERIQVASLGMEDKTRPLVGMLYPATEGERTFVGGRYTDKRWALRSHPIQVGLTQEYSAVLRLTTEPDFPEALKRTWDAAYDLFDPVIYDCDLTAVYDDSINLLNRYWKNRNGVPGFPFNISFPDGVAGGYNYQMGFVGMQIPNASLMVREGLKSSDSTLRTRGEQIIDWWSANVFPSDTGFPWTWVDADNLVWRDYDTFLRVATDGMIGILWAWRVESTHGVNKAQWLDACERFGDWLLSWQNPDGSIPRRFDFWTGEPVVTSPRNTSHMVRYLTELYLATGSPRFKQAALRAGEFIYTDVYQNFRYVGGTADNPNVPDKEAASMSLRAFMALYDLTGEDRWRDAAVQTGYYYSSWVFAWPVPIFRAPSDPELVYPSHRLTTGTSRISTGNGGVDSYAATDAFELYRLYLSTGESALLETARLMLYNTKQPMDWDDTDPLGYGDAGILNEFMYITGGRRGTGVDQFLPWQTANLMEPLVHLADTFGTFDIQSIEQQPAATREAANTAFARNRGYLTSQLLPTATASPGQVFLEWTPDADAASYTVQRAEVPGGPYTTLATVSATEYVDGSVVNGTTYYYVVTVPGASSPEVSATPGLVPMAHYPFDGDVLDSSGAGNHGTNFGATFVTDSAAGTHAANFDGDDRIEFPASIGQTHFTIALWVKTTETGGTNSQWWTGQGLIDAEVSGAAADFGTALLDGKFALGIGMPDTTLKTTRNINDGQWHHVAASWDVNTGAVHLYVDGVPNTAGTAPTGARTASTVIQAGRIRLGGAFLTGQLDDVRLYNRVLSASEIALLGAVPWTPTEVVATSWSGRVLIDWTVAPGATGYNVKRALSPGGPYTTIATNLTGTGFMDTGLAPGVTGYYAVSSYNGNFESADSVYDGNQSGQILPVIRPPGTPPVSLAVDAFEDPWTLYWIEEQTVTLPADITVDRLYPGGQTIGPSAVSSNRVVKAGTEVTSYLLHLDSPSSTTLTGDLTLPDPVFAVIFTTANLDATDSVLGLPGLTYPSLGLRGGLDEVVDVLSVSPDSRSIDLTLQVSASPHLDQLRFLTLHPQALTAPGLDLQRGSSSTLDLTIAGQYGYDYTLQDSTNLIEGVWEDLPGWMDVPGEPELLLPIPLTPEPQYFRVITE